MRRTHGMASAFTLGLGLLAGGCGSAEPAPVNQPAAVQLAPENVITAARGQISAGPTISGQLTPAREATVRAQVGGSLVALAVDRGQSVANGAEIARITSRDLDAARTSADVAVRSAETMLNVTKSEAQRTESLVKGGALAARDLEQAQNAVSAAEAQVAAAKARLRSADQQIDDTSVKAPFAGVVSDRPASIGDVVTPGTALVTIIDPSSMRLEAMVPSDKLPEVKRGAKVRFTIRGVPGDFVGTVDRLNSSVDPVTRQVSVFVTLPNSGGRLLSGLYAEGRIESSTRDGIVVPLGAVDETGAQPFVTRVNSGKAEQVVVTLGSRQTSLEQVEITSGVNEGDVLVVGSAKNIAAGTAVNVVK